MLNNTQKDFVVELIERLFESCLPLYCDTYIQIAGIFSVFKNHEAAYKALLKAVDFTKYNLQFRVPPSTLVVKSNAQDFIDGHKVLKSFFPQILTSLSYLGEWNDFGNFARYLKTRYNINAKVIKKSKNNNYNNKENIPENIRQELAKSFLEQVTENYRKAQVLIKDLSTITSPEWQILKVADAEDLKQKATILLTVCYEHYETLKKILQGKEISLEVMEGAHKAHDLSNENMSHLNKMTSKLLKDVALLRQKQERSKFFETTYQTDESDFLLHQEVVSEKNYRAYQKLIEIQEQQKQVLVEARQKLGKEKRQALQEQYEKSISIVDTTEVEIPCETLLIDCGILPPLMNDYSLEHAMLLHGILSHKFNLGDKDQETLRVILTKEERAFQVTINDIKTLFSKFEGFVHDIHHGGSHEIISGVGLPFMPNADGEKKGHIMGKSKKQKKK